MLSWLVLCVFQWQQHVQYTIDANLDAESHTLSAIEQCVYCNHSPVAIETLYLHLYANAFKDEKTVFAEEARIMNIRGFASLHDSLRGFITIESVIDDRDSLDFHVEETILAVRLPTVLMPGDSVVLRIAYQLQIPWKFARLGYVGDHYEMAHWYPRVCVFDNNGWHLDTYHMIGEFYGEYGTYDVTIDVPGHYVVAATGERVDTSDIMFMNTLLVSGRKMKIQERRRVRFRAERVHDFAWVCDPDFLVSQSEVDGITIQVFYFENKKNSWHNAPTYAVDAVTRYNKWFMQYPYKILSVVSGYGYEGVEYPQLVIIDVAESGLVKFTRLFELVIAHEIAHQWFYGILGSNEIDEAWLDEGFASYAEVRYLEDKYGKDYSLLTVPFAPALPRTYLHRLVYYISQTNQIEKPVLTPAHEFIDMPFAYLNSAYSKPALFLMYLEGLVGRSQFNRIMKRYCQEYSFKHPTTQDFLHICEEETRRVLDSLFYQILNTTCYSDWAVKCVAGNRVEVVNTGSIRLPGDVLIETESGAQIVPLNIKQRVDTINVPESAGRVKKVTIDPHGYMLDANLWNNHYPRKLRIKPIAALPSFDHYTIIYMPYLWYSQYDGIKVGMYFAGDQFADLDFVKGEHQWLFGADYGFTSEKMYVTSRYQTPILFERGVRTRVHYEGTNVNDELRFHLGVSNSFGVPFARSPEWKLYSRVSYYRLFSYEQVDSIDWELGTVAAFENMLSYENAGWHAELGVFLGHQVLGSEWDYSKFTITMKKELHAGIPMNIRLFAGRIFGEAPLQQQLFLSGALRINFLADLIFSQNGYFSPQEHTHIEGDGNMLGYKQLHIKSDRLICINYELPSSFPLRLFFDAGYYDEYVADFGTRLVIGPFSFNVPFYTKTDEPWTLRWSIGF